MATDTTRPANTGGIDITGLDIAWAIFEATGGGYGSPQGGGSDDATLGEPRRTGDWVAGDGRTPDGTNVPDSFDFGSLIDPLRDIMLTTDDAPSDNPLLALMAPEETPDFANGGPEGQALTGIEIAVAVAAVAIVVAVVLAVKHWGVFDTAGETAVTPTDTKALPTDDQVNKAAEAAKKPGGVDYLENPDADQAAPVDDGLVLKDLLQGLLGTTDVAALAAKPEAFMAAVANVMNGLLTGKVGALGALMSGIDHATDGTFAGAMEKVLDGFGGDGLGDVFPFMAELDGPDGVLSVESLRDAFVTAAPDQMLTPPHDGWW